MAIRALLLDFDGTLAESLPALRRAYERFVAALGGVASTAEFDSLNGPPLREVVERLCVQHQGRPHSTDDLDAYHDLVAEEWTCVAPARGARNLLDAAAGQGIRCAIVTSSTADLVSAWLRANDLADSCDLIISGDDVEAGKPSPEPYQLALDSLGVSPDEALAIEDSVSGVLSATAAGIPTLRLTRSASAGTEAACIATLEEGVRFLDGAPLR